MMQVVLYHSLEFGEAEMEVAALQANKRHKIFKPYPLLQLL